MSTEYTNVIYGKLNLLNAKNTYHGGETSTASVSVDNSTNTIYVNTKIDTKAIEKELALTREEYQKFVDAKSDILARLATTEETCAQLSTKVSELDVKIGSEVSRIDLEILQIKSDLSTQVQSLNTKINNVLNEVDNIKDQLITVNEQIKAAFDLITIINQKLVKIETSISDLDTKLATTKTELLAEIQQVKTEVKEEILPKLDQLLADLSTEELSRTLVDADLQEQIKAINGELEVVDTVNTKNDLILYDTSKLSFGDNIKVLNDESRNNRCTFYKYIGTSNSSDDWTFVSESSLSYTKAEVDEKVTTLDTKINTTKVMLQKEISDVKTEVQEEILPKLNALDTKIDNTRSELQTEINKKQETLVSGQNIKTLNNESLLGAGNIDITSAQWGNITGNIDSQADLKNKLDSKQEKLISGSNIKTLNGDSLLGSGNIDIKSAEWGKITGTLNSQTDLMAKFNNYSLKSETETKLAELLERVNVKCDHLFYDQFGTIDPDFTEVWYLMSWVDGEEKIVAGPYTLGGGGGGGSITEMTSELKKFPETVSRSATSCEIVFNWTSVKGTSKVPTGTGTIYIYVNDHLEMKIGNAPQGDNTIDILSAIKDYTESKVTVNIKVVDAYNNYEQKTGTIQFVEINLTSTFDADTIFKAPFTYACTPVGIGLSKTLFYYVDGGLVGKIENIKTSGEQVSYLISKGADGEPLKHGAHTLKVYFTCMISGQEVMSNILKYNFMYEVAGDTTPMITSSFDDSIVQTQYISFTIPYKVYSPGKTYSEVELSVNGEVVSKLPLVKPETQYWEYRASEFGNYQMVISCGELHKILNVTVKEAEIHIDPVTDKLALYLTAIGRSNAESEEERKKWQYKYIDPSGEEQVIEATLYNFNFSSDGWLQDKDGNTVLRVAGDAQVEIPYKIFEEDFKDTGKTIEFEFSTSQVMDYNTEIISCFYSRDSLSVGLSITAQEAMFKSIATEGVSSLYKEEEHIRIAFTVEKKNESRLVFMYINGVLCNAIQYPNDDSFRLPVPANITIGSTAATTDIYCIRVYDNNLTMKLVVNNWIADTQSGELKQTRYLRNNIFSTETGEITPETIPDNLPYMIWDIDPLPQYKGDKRPGNSRYVEKLRPDKNFTAKNAQFNVQGTSSAVYPVKNIRIKYKLGKNDDGTLWDPFEWYDDEGNTIKKYGIRDDSIKDNYFTHKVDFASSEGVNNVELTRYYNDVAKEWKYLNPPQKLDDLIRVGVDGIPIASFWKDVNGNITFNSKANFNNDKANEAVYGFEGHWDDETLPMEERTWVGDESWEVTQNNVRVALFQDPVTPENFSEGFEIRFPDEDGYDKLDKLGPMTAWVSSTDPLQATDEPLLEPKQYTYTTVIRSEDGSYITKEVTSPVFTTDSAEYRLIKFKAELKDWFDVNSTIFYYVFTHMFLLVDSRAKNCFPTYFASRTPGDGGNRWFWLPYDMDTAIGINNEGKLRFSFNLEDTDKDEKGANVFNGQDSVMWCNLRRTFLAEISLMYYGLRNYSAARSVNFSFDDVEGRFYEHQSKWPENLFNKDSQIKYIDTLVKAGLDYLEMLQGDKALQRKWWLYNRFKYMDAKYLAGDARSNVLIFRAYGKSDMDITPFADTYINVSFANSADAYVSVRGKKGITYHITNPLSGEVTDQETHIYGVDQLKSLGDLSGFKPDTVQADKAIHLQELKIGDGAETYINPNLTSINVSKNTQLQYLDVRHCNNLTQTVDLSNCASIETVWCEGSSVLGVTLPNAGILKSLHVPNTITKLIIKNHPLLTDLVIENIAGLALSELWIENMKNCRYNVMDLVQGMNEGTLVRLIDFDLTYDTVAQVDALYDKLDTLKGTDSQGRLVDKAQLNGKIKIREQLTYAEWKRLSDRYTDVVISADVIRCTVNFYKTEEGAEIPKIHNSQIIEKGKAATKPETDPVKDPTPQHTYTFESWDKEFNKVETDLEIYPIYKEATRYYKVDFDTRTTKVTVPSQYIEYQGKVIKPADPKIVGVTFLGWYTKDGTAYLFLTTPVVEDFTLYAKWSSDLGPDITLTNTSYKTFLFKLTDDVAIIGYAITTSPLTPTEWIELTPTSEYIGNYEVEYPADYYVWAKDENDHINNVTKSAYELTCVQGEGTEIILKSGETLVYNYALHGTNLKVNYTANEHYEGVKFYYNGTEVEVVPFDITVTAACTFLTTSEPKEYLVQFNNGEYGEKPEDQIVKYGRLVEAPANQFVLQRIIEGWYTESTFEKKWNFTVDTITGELTLYAKWIIYEEPSIIGITITDDTKTIKCNYDQRVESGVEVDWGDGSGIERSTKSGVVTLEHTYTSTGNYEVQIRCRSGAHYLGGKSMDKPVISPAKVINSIEFAWNMPYTSEYALYKANNLTTVIMSKYMTKVATGTFYDCLKLKSISLPNTIINIESLAFRGCIGFSGKFEIPNSVIFIGNQAFYGCKGLTEFEIPDSVKSISESAFKNCTGLLSFIIPEYITELSSHLLEGCSSLTSILIPETVEKLGSSVFSDCSNLASVIIMNENLIAGTWCFDNCFKLKTGGPFGDGNIYNFMYTWKTKIPDKLFEVSLPGASALESFVLADTIEEIGNSAFAKTTLKTINFPRSLRTIGDSAFSGCGSLVCDGGVLELPNGLKTINQDAFSSCTNLTHIIIPASVEYIGNLVFYNCLNLKSVHMYTNGSTNKIETYLTAWFRGCSTSNLIIIYIPKAIKDKVSLLYGAYWNYANMVEQFTYSASLE